MEFVSDPPVWMKIQKMKQRVRWQEPIIVKRGIDQTQLVIDDGQEDQPEFSFLVIGDSGSGAHREHHPQRKIAEQMLLHRDDCRFVLHTGDVVYLVGSSEYYHKNFIEPYREFLVNGEKPKNIKYDQMLFNYPFLPVLGNHDYYDLPFVYGLLAQTALPLRRLFRSQIDFDAGWHGSFQGEAYAKAFLDYLLDINNRQQLEEHLDRFYNANTNNGRCLRYQPKEFTRLPNRYYTFRSGGIDFFALDSNTFNSPLPLSEDAEGDANRRILEKRRADARQEQQEIMQTMNSLNPDRPEEAERFDDLRTKLEQLEEIEKDVDKHLNATGEVTVDWEQLNWLQQRLIESWHTDSVRGRVIYLHHPPYVTEATKWYQSQTLAVRYRLREVLDEVAKAVGNLAGDRPLVDLVLTGHAHCLEYLRTTNTGHGDSHINWIVCGGSGYSLRRQREEGLEITQHLANLSGKETRTVARSLLFIGRSGQGYHKRRPYSFLRIDVRSGTPPKFVIRPFVVERYQQQWHENQVKPFEI
ncbi:metallophosphoesterase [Aerosakkonemataceae cyanobacterium BLCC-F50]|uniref:Metallophosphoesterase n=1 Tax=Floridaenema flaviceps BLCC-F50 TaxID=3153642 RepID=A0ABV4XMX1_9CYAN